MIPAELEIELVRKALRRGQTILLRAASSSMSPQIRPGALLTVSSGQPRVGDAAVYWYEPLHGWAVHRVTAEDTDTLDVADAKGNNAYRVPRENCVGLLKHVSHDSTSVFYRARSVAYRSAHAVRKIIRPHRVVARRVRSK